VAIHGFSAGVSFLRRLAISTFQPAPFGLDRKFFPSRTLTFVQVSLPKGAMVIPFGRLYALADLRFFPQKT